MKIEVTQATNIQLNWMAAKASGMSVTNHDGGVLWGNFASFSPVTDWSQAGPIIEQEFMEIRFERDCSWHSAPAQDVWVAVIPYKVKRAGPTPLVAAMLCYVTSKLGDEVDVPDELCE